MLLEQMQFISVDIATKDHHAMTEHEDVYTNMYTHACEYGFYIYVCV